MIMILLSVGLVNISRYLRPDGCGAVEQLSYILAKMRP